MKKAFLKKFEVLEENKADIDKLIKNIEETEKENNDNCTNITNSINNIDLIKKNLLKNEAIKINENVIYLLKNDKKIANIRFYKKYNGYPYYNNYCIITDQEGNKQITITYSNF